MHVGGSELRMCTPNDRVVFQVLTCVDIGASINRSPKGWDGVVLTLTPPMTLWLHQPGLKAANRGDRLLLGEEAMQLKGFPKTSLSLALGITDAQLRDLAGNAFSSSPFLALYMALLTKMPVVKAHEGLDLDALKRIGSFMQ